MAAETPVGARNRALAAVHDLVAAGRDETPRTVAAIKALNDRNEGVCASNVLIGATAPTATDTVLIGASDVYEFVAAAGSVAADTNIAVLRAGVAATDSAALIAAINGADADNKHPTIFLADGVTPALANGTENVVADLINTTSVRIRSADGPGGVPIAPAAAADVDLACTETMTPAGNIWDHANLNLSPFRVAGSFMAMAEIKILAAMITSGHVRIDFPFVVEGFMNGMGFTTATGANVVTSGAGADLITIDNGGINIALGGGAAPDIVVSSTVTLVAWGSVEAT